MMRTQASAMANTDAMVVRAELALPRWVSGEVADRNRHVKAGLCKIRFIAQQLQLLDPDGPVVQGRAVLVISSDRRRHKRRRLSW
eukprot:6186821-Pleurochrysis_carterae.AAC.1